MLAILPSVVAFVACSQSPQSRTALPPMNVSANTVSNAKKSDGLIYVTDLWLKSSRTTIEAAGYPINGTGPQAPTIELGGDQLGIETQSAGIAVSPDGSVALDGNDGPSGNAAVNVYAPGANGNVAPTTVYSCSGMGEPAGLAFDHAGNLYAFNFNLPREGSHSIFVFPAGSPSGCPANTHLIFGKRTRLFGDPGGIAVARNAIYVDIDNTNHASAILRFPASANGNHRPSHVITGKKTTLEIPDGIAVDGHGDILVVDNYAQRIDIFAPDAKGNVAPIRVIKGPHTQLYQPTGIAVSNDGRIFVANSSFNSNVKGDSITVYAPDAKGDAKPIQMIPGGQNYPQTELAAPTALA
ncbi:MAG: hypothetical protein JO311_08180, partial [Candidatus Eremiobacteraeota bacterium]|nr:hypothetical protein [Candidatus Eremiobacteraeota bacterium]